MFSSWCVPRRLALDGLLLLICHTPALALPAAERFVHDAPSEGAFPLAAGDQGAPLWVDRADWPGVIRAAGDLRDDIERVTGILPELRQSISSRSPSMVIIGTVGRSRLLDELIANGKISVDDIRGAWESWFIQVVADPLPGVDAALVIAGSDKRGTIYGIYEVSAQIGVSPWYWWADVAPDPKDGLYIIPGRFRQGEPSVKYRGIFLNDEKPDLDHWVRATYGARADPSNPEATVANFNSDFYARIFEVLLRLKGNYLWPAMWNNAFAEDDPANARLADEYGIVMGTSHQEPMMRAQKEWDWHRGQELGNWNFATQESALTEFWREGVRERADFENIYTIGLRGENDTEMVHGKAESMRLLERIVDVQRRILAEDVNPDVTEVPQVWTLYKEVQGYYESGLRVPDDVTLLWAEDNWGNVRRLPTADERDRAGGAGVYYHFDYHGGPRSYQWINTNPVAKVWDQMSLAKDYGADRIWIVNAGHFKGYELPTEFFLDLAWDTARWRHHDIREYMVLWAAEQFGDSQATQAAGVLAGYTRFNGRRKPELLRPDTYNLVDWREWQRVIDDYNALVDEAEAIDKQLPAHKQDAFYQLALFPAKASAQVNELYYAAALNELYAEQGRAATNAMADRVRALFAADQALMHYFNVEYRDGKWQHFMEQPKIGYVSWRDPPADSLDAIDLQEIEVPAGASLGIAVAGDRRAWPGPAAAPSLPEFDVFGRQRQAIEIFNRGSEVFDFSIETSDDWVEVGERSGTVELERHIPVSVDWTRAPEGRSTATLDVTGAGQTVTVTINAFNPASPTRVSLEGFVESQGLVSAEAERAVAINGGESRRWQRIEDYGHTLSGMRAVGPVDAPPAVPGENSPSLEYRMYLFTPGEVTAELIVGPTLNFMPGRGLRLAVSFDDEVPRIVELVPEGYDAANGNSDWEQSVRDNARRVRTTHEIAEAGYHRFRIWMVDPGVIVQKLIVRTARAPEESTYLGPPETFRNNAARQRGALR